MKRFILGVCLGVVVLFSGCNNQAESTTSFSGPSKKLDLG